MMLSDIPHMQRQKLAILERVQHDMSRVINPVFHSFTIAAAIYLPCYVNRVFFSNAGGLDLLNFLLALSAIALVLMSPAFALAATLEVYIGRRIAKASRGSVAGFEVNAKNSIGESLEG